ncbi:MAG: toprim domain-containing protein [Desulfobulbaceae bacterium]|nr:toprim domain-containing protein [Desulfobulbaceae bacterium]
MQNILESIASTHHLHRRTDRWVGPCPKCGGSTTSDKFNLRDDGGFKCYSCGFCGDIITWLREMEGKSCGAAHDEAGLACRKGADCPNYGSCRMGDGSGRRTQVKKHSVQPMCQKQQGKLAVSQTVKEPDQLWQAWASAFTHDAAATISGQKAQLTWLASRGIDMATVQRFGLGWLQKNDHVNRAGIGLSPERDGKRELWVPAGLVIPIMGVKGEVHRLRVRRPSWAREKFLPNRKYVWIEGSGNKPMVIHSIHPCRGAVIVEAELDAIAVAAAHQDVLVVAIGTVQGPITMDLMEILTSMPVILVALDADADKDGKKGAGQAAVSVWLRAYRQAKYWPVTAGKDPGDFVKEHQGDLRAWVEGGLVPPLPSISHAPMHISGGSLRGEGEEALTAEEKCVVFNLHGHLDAAGLPVDCYVTEDQPLWHQLTMEGKIVFSKNELSRLTAVCAGMGEEERRQAARMTVDIKETFAASYIRAGRVEATK